MVKTSWPKHSTTQPSHGESVHYLHESDESVLAVTNTGRHLYTRQYVWNSDIFGRLTTALCGLATLFVHYLSNVTLHRHTKWNKSYIEDIMKVLVTLDGHKV